MNPRPHKPRLRTTYRLIIEERDNGWEVVFYNEQGGVQHIGNSQTEIAALRSAYFIARYYHYEHDVLMRTRHGDKRLDIETLMQNRRPS
ncbi:MAG: hypothetical protein LLP51_03760 [Halorhodospira halophila]|uniref:hypothetical protein n=1 Tax=Halorhodospira TaxID=85108 RepID=UPI0019137497|nr:MULTISPECIES: hypothetical protein [Halorhodospira]MBK5936795.1 hypothetical protein [Halorhodospira halophila]MBK5942863.1 hypothetical protein [Halorhodospira halophila]MCC3750497.1 hypothetical protein [Halorhodospira halophila]MCG5528769.1 hypothetical protein [Halorhodospira halophila]MCG5533440.1 hypothetical protein [Halorhodospira sp. 9621]